MTDIVVISLPDDETRVEPVVAALHARDTELWWQRSNLTSDTVTDAIAGARCVLFFVTSRSVVDAHFLERVAEANDVQTAIAVLLDDARLPAYIDGLPRVDMTAFRGGKTSLYILDLKAAAERKARGLPPPYALGPLARLGKQALIFIAPLTLVLAVIDNAANFDQFKDYFRQPEKTEKAMVSALIPGDCQGLRGYLARYPDGFYAERATALISAADPKGSTIWKAESGDLERFVGGANTPRANTEAQARARLTRMITADADTGCRAYAKGVNSRDMTFDVVYGTANCDRDSGGWFCWAKPTVTCKHNIETYAETCGTLRP